MSRWAKKLITSIIIALSIIGSAHLYLWRSGDQPFREAPFKLHNYSLNSPEYHDDLRKLIPVGSHRTDVESLLIKSAGLQISIERREPNHIVYYEAVGLERKRLNGLSLCWVLDYFCRRKWISVAYDQNQNAVQVSANGTQIY